MKMNYCPGIKVKKTYIYNSWNQLKFKKKKYSFLPSVLNVVF